MNDSIKKVLLQAEQDLGFLGKEESCASAEFLLADLLKCSRSDLGLRASEMLDEPILKIYQEYIDRRKAHEPVAYILGKAHFWNEELVVNRNCLIPRSETELIVEKFIEKLEVRRKQPLSVLDLCAGSGAIGIAILREFTLAQMTFSDLSQKALDIISKNLLKYDLNARSKIIRSNLFAEMPFEKWDVIVCNPPYLSYSDWENAQAEIKQEPEAAFLAGEDGFDFYRKIIDEASGYLSPMGIMFLEMGQGQAPEIVKLAAARGFREIETIKDFQDIDRVLIARI